jgi:hypothetical protein
MKKKDIKKLCRDVDAGKVREVEHMVTHQHGEVIACDGTSLEVKTGENLKHWEGQNCERS